MGIVRRPDDEAQIDALVHTSRLDRGRQHDEPVRASLCGRPSFNIEAPLDEGGAPHRETPVQIKAEFIEFNVTTRLRLHLSAFCCA
jgi:hypothetical protein